MKALFRLMVPTFLLVGAGVLWWNHHYLPQHYQSLVQDLKSTSSKLQDHAHDSLANAGPNAAPYVLQGMETGSQAQKLRLANVLTGWDKASLPWLHKMLDHKDWRIRELGVKAIHKVSMGEEHRAQLLNRSFRDENPYVRYSAVRQLQKLQRLDPSVRLAMLQLLREGNKPLTHDKDGHHHHGHSHHDSKHNPSITRIIEGRLCHTPDDVDREVRLAIVRTLPRLVNDHKLAATALLGALEDRDRLVREEAYKHIQKMGAKALSSLVGYLQRDKAPHKPKASSLLVHVGQPALTPLKVLLYLPKRTGWVYAARALQQMGAIASPLQKSLCKLWPTLPPNRLRPMGRVLASMGPSAIPCLLRRMQHPSSTIRAVAAYSAGRLAKSTAAPLPKSLAKRLVQLLQDTSLPPRNESLWALGQWGKRAKDLIASLLSQEKNCSFDHKRTNPSTSPSSLPTTLPSASSSTPSRSGCTDLLPRAWVQIAPNNPQVIQTLTRWLQHPSALTVRGAALALLSLKKLPPSLEKPLVQQLQHPHKVARRAVVETLAHHPQALFNHHELLRKALQAKQLDLRLDALALLSRMGRRKSLAHILWQLLSKRVHRATTQEQIAIMKVLTALYPRMHSGSLALGDVFLKHAKPAIRIAALRLLARAPKPKPFWVRYVAYQLQDIRWRVRRAAIQTLGAWGPFAKAAQESVRARIKDPSFAVSMEAQHALLRIKGKQPKQNK
ncbi:MAG: HEAT repeat domain-containing protein [Deltaproteobacteria bacterium]|nr:MAG: HEAT repeat domain-containing protein [Deltaproteobacteria bacterium]